MIINKLDSHFTDEEINKKLAAFNRLLDEVMPFYNREFSGIERYIKKYTNEVQKIEDQVRYRYILSFSGDKSAILKDIAEILNAVTIEDFKNKIESYDQLSPMDSLVNTNTEQSYHTFYFFLTQILYSQTKSFLYYNYPLNEIEQLIDQKVSQRYKKTSKQTESIRELPTTNSKKITDIKYPLDKVNSVLWGTLCIKENTILKAENDKDTKRGKQANIYVLLDFEELDGVKISRPLTIFDKRVWNAVANLKEQGHDIITAIQIYRAMGYTSTLNSDDKSKILESIEVISKARVTIDTTEENKLYPQYDSIKAKFPLLSTEVCTVYSKGNIVEDAIRIIEMPKLFLFAKQREQITSAPLKLFASPISKTPDNLLLEDYLFTRIARMKNSTCWFVNDVLHNF